MTYSYKIGQEEGMLRLEVEGRRTLKDSQGVWDTILEYSEKTDIRRVLVTLRLTGRLTTTQHYYLADYASEVLQKAGVVRTAVVDYNERSLPDNLFGETVVRNRGALVAVFDDLKKAERWLTE